MEINLTSGKSIKIKKGTSVLEALKESGIHLTTSCGSKGTCGKCKIVIQSGKADIQSKIKLTQDEIKKGYALACKTFPSEDIAIEIPKESRLIVEGKIATGRSKDLLAL
jgi:uncharacterized 2Fe-2S/4Fe-4S cluster protein (DUF4445 family)